MVISPDGKFLAAGGSVRTIAIFDAATGAELTSFSENLKPIYEIPFSPGGEFVALAGADDAARVWRISDRKLIHEF